MSGLDAELLTRLEVYYDSVPRGSATAEDIGPFTLFVATSGQPFYARPRLGADVGVTGAAVQQVLGRQRELAVPLAIEWVAENAPTLEPVVADAGLEIEHCPLLVLRGEPQGGPGSARMLGPDDVADLAPVQAAIGVAFRVGGTAVGPQGLADRAAILKAETVDDALRTDLVAGQLRVAAAYAALADGPVGGGRHNPVGNTSEITGVGVLPAYRGQGLGAALSYVLARDALDRGATTVFCSAESDDVARIYARVGFRRVATACMATG